MPPRAWARDRCSGCLGTARPSARPAGPRATRGARGRATYASVALRRDVAGGDGGGLLWLNAAGETSVKNSGSVWRQAAVARCFGFGARWRQDVPQRGKLDATQRDLEALPSRAGSDCYLALMPLRDL